MQKQSEGLCQGTVEVVSVDRWMWSAQVIYQGEQRTLWWDQWSMMFYNGTLTTPTLAAKPGDVINIDGMLSDGEIYLGREWIGTAPPTALGIPSQNIALTPAPPSKPQLSIDPIPGGITPLPLPSQSSPAPASAGITPLPLPNNTSNPDR